MPPSLSWYLPLKGGVDFALATLLLALTAPLILLLVVLVRLTSSGPALYTQVRLGRGGRRYVIYKIRTMIHDCERLSGPRWSPPRDPRVTWLGRFLRACHMDELPQLWNVLRGEMSLVGPRPERPVFVAQLECVVPDYRERQRVRPGITGLAQILLPPDEDITGVCRKVACDRCYIEEMGPWLDARILVGTVLKVAAVPVEIRRRLLHLPGGEEARCRKPPAPRCRRSETPPRTSARDAAAKGAKDASLLG